MKYTVLLSTAAEGELEEAYQWLAEQAPQHSVAWYNEFLDALYSLEHSPARCPRAAESADSGGEVRVLLFGHKRHAYRILFTVRDDAVLVLHLRHAARLRG